MLDKKIADKLDAGRQYRKIEIANIETRAEDEKDMVVEGYATVFNTPYELFSWDDYIVSEQVDANAFDEADMSDVIMQYDHEGRVFARVTNKTLELIVDKKGLKIRAHLGGTELGRQLYDEIRQGYITKMSFGFTVAEDKREITEDRENHITKVLRTITRIKKLYDVSAVSIPANDATDISARSYSEGVIEGIRKELSERKKKIIRILLEG